MATKNDKNKNKKKTNKIGVKWLLEPDVHNYPAAESYLNLVLSPASKISPLLVVTALRTAPVVTFKAKDIFRASKESLLGVSNFHVKQNIKKIKNGVAISPILLVRDHNNGKVIIADGYHRLCAMYRFNEDEDVPCKIV